MDRRALELEAIVEIMNVDSYVHPDNSLQISIDGKALDSVMSVFDMNMDFSPETIEQRDRLHNDLRVDSIHLIKGEYGAADDIGIMMFNPSYQSVESGGFSLQEIEEMFALNDHEEPIRTLQKILKTDEDLSFLMKLEKNQIEILVAQVRASRSR
jgi:hypothetical protein